MCLNWSCWVNPNWSGYNSLWISYILIRREKQRVPENYLINLIMREYNIHTSGLYRICAGSVTLCKPKSQEEHEKEQLTLKFKSYRKTIKHPFTIVADTECILEPKEDADESDATTVKTAVHIPCTASYLLSSHLPGYENEQVQVFHGIDCIDEFLESINVLYERLRPVLEMVKPMEKVLVDQATLALLDSNPNCAICESKKVLKEFDLKSLNEMVHLYISSDVVLLDSVLQQYRTECLSSYNLDPVHYYTAPSLTWVAGLKFTKVELELFTDMYTFIEQAIRGGISTITHRYAKANNHHLPDYNPE